MKRAIVIVLDGCGAGEAPDAPAFGDYDHPSTIKHVWEAVGGFDAPTLESIGFLDAGGIHRLGADATGRWGRLRELSMGKDSVTGHWEMMGVVTERPFPTYPNGFPADLIEEFEARIGTRILGNKAASGTAIIDELGPEHVKSGQPIVYTSADSVFQIATHEEVVPIERLYEMCRIAREICVPPNDVQRVIARPFVGEAGSFKRTERRQDFPLPAPPNLIDQIGGVFGIGVVPELFGGRGFLPVHRTQSNVEHTQMLWQALESDARFIFANFEDFDMLYGHRNDPVGFARALEAFDPVLRDLMARLTPDDLLIITADHGNDPTSPSTDHSREYVPVCVIGAGSGPLGDVEGMTAIGATVARHLGVDWSVGMPLSSP
ncbi:phosphopentomutase [Fimbriimonas ginsengisoli]|uniref:Phosphopentomutase n=1 Tax=Fimbriimonas ginsengisoli Gsoil 348 TaxID=661478 RepID=A0A068NQK6_FIMGI|nr:phosphopentomutase [Fimbriimonas ginsengisoli]AIE85711.1 phosphopentomutase [Fimbriimonas ginsengisoli Gsoil 348]